MRCERIGKEYICVYSTHNTVKRVSERERLEEGTGSSERERERK